MVPSLVRGRRARKEQPWPSLDADLRGLASVSDSDAPDPDAPDTDAPDDRLHELERRLTHLRNLLDPEDVLELYGTPPANPA